ncbi:MAG: bifunctional oligoribonuclease/PAP phosphatase NrnA [Candidatus Izemoplasmatales bacterium]
MFDSFIRLVDTNEKIIILRHQNPDLDALGAQFGLCHALRLRYPTKTILVAGDTNALNQFGPLDPVDVSDYREALVVILDTVSRQMLEGDLYEQAKTLVLIDHHRNDPDIRHDLWIQRPEASSTAEIVARFLIDAGWTIPLPAAEALYMGIVADTGRFLYKSVSPETFRIAASLLEAGIDIQTLYDRMYAESLSMKKLKSAFFNSISLTAKNVAYRKNDEAFLKRHEVDTHTVSRGLVNQMAGIREVPIWANFTYDLNTGRIFCELRSRSIPILDVAKKFGGGGHLQACGCVVDSWEATDEVLAELDKKTEEE